MKQFLTVLLAALGMAAFTAPVFAQTVSLDSALNAAVIDLTGKIPGGTRVSCPRINAASPELADYITSKLGARLVRDTRFVVVNRDNKAVDAEIGYQLRGNVSDETAVSVTAQLGAQAVIAGSLQKSGSRYRLDIRAIDVEKNQIISHWSGDVAGGGELAKYEILKTGLVFDGSALSDGDKKTVLQGIQKGIQANKLALQIPANVKDAQSAGSSQHFAVTVEYEEKNSLVVGTMAIELVQDGVPVCSSNTYHVTETTVKRFIQRCADKIRDDQAFWAEAGKQ